MIINLNRYLSRIAFATAIQFVLTFGLTVGAQAQTAAPSPAPGENPAVPPHPTRVQAPAVSSNRSSLQVT